LLFKKRERKGKEFDEDMQNLFLKNKLSYSTHEKH